AATICISNRVSSIIAHREQLCAMIATTRRGRSRAASHTRFTARYASIERVGYNALASFSFQTDRSDSTGLGCNKWELDFENERINIFSYKRQQHETKFTSGRFVCIARYCDASASRTSRARHCAVEPNQAGAGTKPGN